MVPGEGIEPPTFGLQNRCSTAELTRRFQWALVCRRRGVDTDAPLVSAPRAYVTPPRRMRQVTVILSRHLVRQRHMRAKDSPFLECWQARAPRRRRRHGGEVGRSRRRSQLPGRALRAGTAPFRERCADPKTPPLIQFRECRGPYPRLSLWWIKRRPACPASGGSLTSSLFGYMSTGPTVPHILH
jgi:hypothetical protein